VRQVDPEHLLNETALTYARLLGGPTREPAACRVEGRKALCAKLTKRSSADALVGHIGVTRLEDRHLMVVCVSNDERQPLPPVCNDTIAQP
jgi:hypothetical protein